MAIFSLFVLLAVLCVSFGEWALDTTSSAAVITGVGAPLDDVVVAAAGANGIGAFVENWQDGKWTKKQIQAGLLLDSAVTPSGNVVATSVWTIFLSNDNGKTFTAVDGVAGACQSANVWGANKENFALVGNWVNTADTSGKPTAVYGVASSKDAGKTWTISSPVPPGWARYGAFPTDTTWYVSSGMWGSSAELKNSKGEYHLSERFQRSLNGGKVLESNFKGNMTSTGWFGAVSKTTDGGKTWTQIFQTDYEKDVIYFNGITCSSELHCAVAGEGYDETGNYKTVGYVTFDGGVTWTASLTTHDVGLMQIDFVSEVEGWAAGTSKQGRNINGQFYHTNDGGKTWELKQTLSNCYAIDMDFAVTKGYAACSSSSGSSCSVAVYNA